MSKTKKAGKHRMNKNTMTLLLEDYFREQAGQTLPFKTIFRDLKLNTHPLKMLAIDVMEEMAWDDFIVRMSDNSYRLNQTDSQTHDGTFIRKPNGRNSFRPDGEEKTVLVTERNSLWALDGDRVRVTYMARRRNHAKEAQVVEILKRAKDTFAGRIVVDDDCAFLQTNDGLLAADIIIPRKKIGKARSGDRVVVRVVRWPDSAGRSIIGEVVDVLGRTGNNDAEMNTILVQYGLPYRYPKEVEDAANRIAAEIPAAEVARREDFREVFTCTIDPHDAKDFDDALSVRRLENGLTEVGVHIADVAHYVSEGSIIDREAQQRATSVYLVDRTIPMLPERLCNFICSLRPDEEKLAFSVVFHLDEEAHVRHYRICKTIIRSDRRYTYEEAQAQLSTDPNLSLLWQLASQLRERRFENGAMKFEGEEMKFDLDADGRPIRCYIKQLHEANHLVEEFMLLANRTVAESIGKTERGKKAKTLPYRIHENPDPQRMENLREFVVKFGYRMKSTGTMGQQSRALNALIDGCTGRPEQKLIQTVALRAMMKAKYSTHNIGHFGLAFDYYTHFTSPIRRYPDLLVHRLLERYQQGQPSANREYYEELCQHSSAMEQTAASAERDSIKYKATEFMADKIGRIFPAHISGITSYGLYCEIDENHCEGMVAMRDLRDDFYDFDEKNYRLLGRRHGGSYQLGDPVRVKVLATDLEKKQIDLKIV